MSRWALAAVLLVCQLGVDETAFVPKFICAILLLGVVWREFAAGKGPFAPEALFIGFSSLYVLTPGLEIALLGNRLGFSPDRIALGLDLGTGFLLAAAIAMALLGRERQRVAPAPRSGDGLRPDATIAAATVAFVAYFGLLLKLYGTEIGAINRAELYSNESIGLSLVRVTVAMGVVFSAAQLRAPDAAPSRRQWSAVLALASAFFLTDLIVLGDRRLGLSMLLAVGAVYGPRRLALRQVLPLVAGGAALLLFAMVRNTPPSEWLGILTSPETLVTFSPAAQEFGTMAVFLNSITDLHVFPADFPNYLEALPQLLPRSILPFRPPAPSEWFSATYFPDYAALGGSFAFNPVIEAMGNGGVFGVVLAGFVYGIALGRVAAVRALGSPVGVGLAAFIFSFAMRMETAALVRTGLMTAIGLIPYVTLSLLRSRRRLESIA